MQTKSISFLHFTDLHYGQDAQSTYISQFKHKLFDDIKNIHKQTGNWDIVFFTGDFVQAGLKEEYDLLSEFFNELWDLFKKLGCSPVFFGVPGNHDLSRHPDRFKPELENLKNWHTNKEFSDKYFWESEDNQYIMFIKERFQNYTNWYANLSIPKPSKSILGYIPGDQACIIEVNGVKVGCVGLNSAFLQLTDAEYKGKLEIHRQQIFKLLGQNSVDWLKSVDIPLLLTHHAPNWLDEKSQSDFAEHIYFPEIFLNHFCGHTHEPNLSQCQSLISTPRKTQIAPSLFGLEYLNNNEERIHGYFAGKFEITDSHINQILYPRIKIRTNDGAYRLAADPEFNLIEDRYIKFPVKELEIEDTIEGQLSLPSKMSESENLFDLINASKQDNICRTNYPSLSQHNVIREYERKNVIGDFNQNRFAWVVSAWGLAEDGFIGSILNDSDIDRTNCFSIICEDAKNTEDIINLFDKTFQISFNNFISQIAYVEKPLLVLKRVNSIIFETSHKTKEFLNFLQIIKEFAPKIKILIVSEQKPNKSDINYTELLPLDIPSVKLYIAAYNNYLDLDDPFSLDKIHSLSSGLPLYIDSILTQLECCTLSDIQENEYDSRQIAFTDGSNNDTTIHRKIDVLRTSKNEVDIRCFELLKILSLLHHGEVFERIKRFLHGNTFYTADVEKLKNLFLIDVTPVHTISFSKQSEAKIIRLLTIPRSARDYIIQLISDDEKNEIYKIACELYFGKSWREGKIKKMDLSVSELSIIVYKNSHLAVRYLLYSASKKNDNLSVGRFAKLGVKFCRILKNSGAYKDSVVSSEEIYNILAGIPISHEQYIHIGIIYGESLRMLGKYRDAISTLQHVVEEGDSYLSNEERASVHLNIAYAYQRLKEESNDKFVYHANTVKKYAKKDSSRYIAADSILATQISVDSERVRKLKSLLNKAKRHKFDIVYNNISLQLSDEIKDKNQKLKQLSNILEAKTKDEYNIIRAIIMKCTSLIEAERYNDITTADVILLNQAYTYSFYQRMTNLLNSCHSVFWKYLIHHKDYCQLLNLYRYSSFVWRIEDDNETETRHLNALLTDSSFDFEKIKSQSRTKELDINISYFIQRQIEIGEKAMNL